LPNCWIEDPELNDSTCKALDSHMHRVTWDANLHALADLFAVEEQPRAVNIKPSRFGFLSELLRFYEYCEARGIAMYGGGQFELGPGRVHIQALASMFHADAPNDVAPSAFNERELPADLPASPMGPVDFV
jgi:L-alanine-DL-glutamate epimerase-like enolase superfamily enzyme